MKATHCRRGHEMTEENTSSRGRCRACHRGERAVPLAPRTHCQRGHELTPENMWIDSRGYRACRICRRLTNARYKTTQTIATIDGARVWRWLGGWLRDHPHVTPAELCYRCDVSQRVLYDLRAGRRKTVYFDTVDKLICGVGQPHLLGCFYNPLPDGTMGPLRALPKPESRPRRTRTVTRCQSGDDCARRSGYGPNGHFCQRHGDELDRIVVEMNEASAKKMSRLNAGRAAANRLKAAA